MDTSDTLQSPPSVAENLTAMKRSIDSNTSILQALLARIAQLEAMVSTLAPSANPKPAPPPARDPPPPASWADRVKANANNHPLRSTGSAPPPPATKLHEPHIVAPALTFKTLLINGKHLNMLRDIAAPADAEPKTMDLRSFNHRLGGATGPFLRDASPGSILPSVSGQHTLDAVVTGPISTFDSIAQFQQAFLDGKVGCAFPSQYISSGDKFIILPNGNRAFTPASAQAFFDRHFTPDRSRAETRIIAIPIAPAPESHLLRRRSTSAQAHVDARNRPRAADDLPPPPKSTPARAPRLVHPPKSRRSIGADLDDANLAAGEHIELNMTALEASADCAHAVIHARAHSTSTAGAQAGKRAPSDDDLQKPPAANEETDEDCAEDSVLRALCTAPPTVPPDSALDMPDAPPRMPDATLASAPTATTLSSDDEESADENADPRHRRRESADENADPRHRRRAGSRQCSPARSPRKSAPPT
jgi:hypothetical protein